MATQRRDPANLFTLLYVSACTAPSADLVAGICEQSRVNNERNRITGLLVFDGEAFCQFVEGAEGAVTDLLGRLERDPRHSNLRVLQIGSQQPRGRRFPNWRLGYAFSADPAAIERLEIATGGAALNAFDSWLPSLVEGA